jgi:mannopine transport system permease protein
MNRGLGMDYGKILLGLFAGIVFVFLVVPTLMTVPMSFTDTRYLVFPPKGFTLHWYGQFLASEDWKRPVLLSLGLACLSSIVSLILGFMASLALVRGVLPGRRFFQIFFISPLMIPVIIISVASYGLFAKFGLIGTIPGLVIGHTILCIPFVILVITANLQRFDVSLEMAARNLGANAIQTFMLITAPLIKTGIIAAGVFCFIVSLDELVLTMFLIGTRKMTLPIKIFSQIRFRLDPVVAAASTVFVMAAIAIIVLLTFYSGKKGQT